MDEGIVSVDGHFISDNEIKQVFLDALSPSCRLLAVFDCCHSSTILDMPITIEYDKASGKFTNSSNDQVVRGRSSA